MKISSIKVFIIACFMLSVGIGYAQQPGNPIWRGREYAVFKDRVTQGDKLVAKALSSKEMTSNYQSPEYLSQKSAVQKEKRTDSHWTMSKDASAFPQYKSDYLISDAIYNMSLEEIIKAVEPDRTFRTRKEWAGVWTRDISYSIILSMAYLQPRLAQNSLMRKVKNGRIIQDTGTGGAYPVGTDRIIWATAAWELYKAIGDREWLKNAYAIIKNSVDADIQNVYDETSGLVKGESIITQMFVFCYNTFTPFGVLCCCLCFAIIMSCLRHFKNIIYSKNTFGIKQVRCLSCSRLNPLV
jgi:hypothetical protein